MVVMTEYLVRHFLLVVGHHGIQSRKGVRQLFDVFRMCLGNLGVGIQIVYCRSARNRRVAPGGVTDGSGEMAR